MLSYGAENVRGTLRREQPLTRHMTEVERHWSRRALAHEDAPPPYRFDHDPNGALNNVDTADVAAVATRWV